MCQETETSIPLPLLKMVGILKMAEQGMQLLHPFVKHGSHALCQKAAQGWRSYCI